MIIDKETRIAIWGTGLFAKKIYNLNCKNYDVIPSHWLHSREIDYWEVKKYRG